jgi:deaminated glutathione amidase
MVPGIIPVLTGTIEMARVAAIQMVSGTDLHANLEQAAALLEEAAVAGARLAVLPENFALMGAGDAAKLAVAELPGAGPIQEFLSTQAARHRLWIVGGTIPLQQAGQVDRAYASCLVFDDQGRQVARFDKIHLFDVHIPGRDESYSESASTLAGDEVVVLDTPVGRLGLAVCYDLRFPELFRHMLDQAVEIVALPSAFTAATGRAHWEVLLRARAIENLCFVVAPNQGGKHAGGRETWGDSLIVDPWGQVLDRLAQGPGVVLGEIDLERQRQTRAGFPALQHRRLPP